MTVSASSRSRGRRLSRSVEFQRVYRQGSSRANRHLVLYAFHRGEGQVAKPRLGISVGRKVGNAVTRNKIKRTIREAIAQLEHGLDDALDYVVLARPDAADLVDREGTRGVVESLNELLDGSRKASDKSSD